MARTDTLPHFLTDVADAIRTKAGTSGTIQASAFDTAIANIPSGGSGWQRPSDWWDTKTIIDNAENKTDNNNDTVYPVYIILLDDNDVTTTFSYDTTNKALYGDGYLTSDGAWYGTTTATHTWDTTQDKTCSEGYKTRYVIVYSKSTTFSNLVNIREFPCLEVITKSSGITFSGSFLQAGYNSTPSNSKIINIELYGITIITTNYIFGNLYSLQNLYLPDLTTTTKTLYLNNDYSLMYVSAPNCSNFSDGFSVSSCYNIKSIDFPQYNSYIPPMTNLYALEFCDLGNWNVANQANKFTSCYSLLNFKIPSTLTSIPTAGGTNPQFGAYIKYIELYNDFDYSGLNFTYDISLTHSCLVDMLSKLKDVTEETDTYTLTLGATNLAKLTNDEIAVGTAKGWTIN